jgi:hypothetical protein
MDYIKNYKLVKDNNNKVVGVTYIDNDKPWFVPVDENNDHYQQYLKWVAKGNTPEPADEVTE